MLRQSPMPATGTPPGTQILDATGRAVRISGVTW
jgi:hypothetical protein